ncbi:MAG: 5-bromo-4-chloroindolyl phosphate hydrolysis family protein [Boseongicola sp.]|nr:5-bromo-4-chloroindolyl phosphate hydrolysis family protein [Boseongicola sp.]MDD9977743.1 5-bromo-4-chloroindolyl phosphate hydrolysis family protein [Boseongicola sp.]
MIGLIFRIAMLGGAIFVMWNVVETFVRALRAPRKNLSLSKEDRDSAAARDMVAAAMKKLTIIKSEMATLHDGDLWASTEEFTASVEKLNQAVLANPTGQRRARRHLTQFLFGAKSATKKFAKVHGMAPDESRKANFIALLKDLTQVFDKAVEDYARPDIEDLEIEEKVLRELVERTTKTDK